MRLIAEETSRGEVVVGRIREKVRGKEKRRVKRKKVVVAAIVVLVVGRRL